MRRGLLPALAVTLAACGGGAPPKADGRHLTASQEARLLGHYSTLDGKTGFVLDRTAQPYLARYDGTETVMRLAERNGPGGTKEYTSHDPQFWSASMRTARCCSSTAQRRRRGSV